MAVALLREPSILLIMYSLNAFRRSGGMYATYRVQIHPIASTAAMALPSVPNHQGSNTINLRSFTSI
jgi:hypothetical protein